MLQLFGPDRASPTTSGAARVARATGVLAVAMMLASCGGVDGRDAATVAAATAMTGTTATAPHRVAFTVPLAGGAVQLGAATLTFPAHAICDPALTTYGRRLWNDPCTTVTTAMAFTATVTEMPNGSMRLDIHPSVRFRPSTSAADAVWLELPAGRTGERAVISWIPTGSTFAFNEGRADTTMSTVLTPATHRLRRRLKHFSGYQGMGRMDGDSVSTETAIAP